MVHASRRPGSPPWQGPAGGGHQGGGSNPGDRRGEEARREFEARGRWRGDLNTRKSLRLRCGSCPSGDWCEEIAQDFKTDLRFEHRRCRPPGGGGGSGERGLSYKGECG
ncbi:hypothetical protein NL676_007384 [Syzygium grande]|nr:hypothetical protein NL676_007384 [Syzygium grande]